MPKKIIIVSAITWLLIIHTLIPASFAQTTCTCDCDRILSEKEDMQKDQPIASAPVPKEHATIKAGPAILGAELCISYKEIKHGSTLILNKYLCDREGDLTTEAGKRVFVLEDDGIKIQEAGLYRVDFFQKFKSEGYGKIWADLFVGASCVRSMPMVFDPAGIKSSPSLDYISFSEIVRADCGDKVQIRILSPKRFGTSTISNGGNITLHGYRPFSGLTIQKIAGLEETERNSGSRQKTATDCEPVKTVSHAEL